RRRRRVRRPMRPAWARREASTPRGSLAGAEVELARLVVDRERLLPEHAQAEHPVEAEAVARLGLLEVTERGLGVLGHEALAQRELRHHDHGRLIGPHRWGTDAGVLIGELRGGHVGAAHAGVEEVEALRVA